MVGGDFIEKYDCSLTYDGVYVCVNDPHHMLLFIGSLDGGIIIKTFWRTTESLEHLWLAVCL